MLTTRIITSNNAKNKKVWSTYGVISSIRKGEPSVIRVYTKVPSMTTPKMLKIILRVTIDECFLWGAVPFLCKIRTDNESLKIIYKITQQSRPWNRILYISSSFFYSHIYIEVFNTAGITLYMACICSNL